MIDRYSYVRFQGIRGRMFVSSMIRILADHIHQAGMLSDRSNDLTKSLPWDS